MVATACCLKHDLATRRVAGWQFFGMRCRFDFSNSAMMQTMLLAIIDDVSTHNNCTITCNRSLKFTISHHDNNCTIKCNRSIKFTVTISTKPLWFLLSLLFLNAKPSSVDEWTYSLTEIKIWDRCRKFVSKKSIGPKLSPPSGCGICDQASATNFLPRKLFLFDNRAQYCAI